jgi:hypothetical protein
MNTLTINQKQFLYALKLDANATFDKIKNRMDDYIEIFAARRIREQFNWAFKNHYFDCSLEARGTIPMDLAFLLDQYFTELDQLHWDLMFTEEMPFTIRTFLERKVHILSVKLKDLNEKFNDYLDETIGQIPNFDLTSSSNEDEISS